MYKQKISGARGPLMPYLLFFANTCVLITLWDYLVRVGHGGFLPFLTSFFFYILAQCFIYRFSFVSLEYVWISDELVFRRKHRGHTTVLLVIPKAAILDVGKDFFGQRLGYFSLGVKNYCGTLRGLLLRRQLVVYVDENDCVKKALFEPDNGLIDAIQKNVY